MNCITSKYLLGPILFPGTEASSCRQPSVWLFYLVLIPYIAVPFEVFQHVLSEELPHTRLCILSFVAVEMGGPVHTELFARWNITVTRKLPVYIK